MLDGISRIRIAERYPQKTEINPPKKGLDVYKNTIVFCKDYRIKLALMLQLNTGIRIGEALDLVPDDVTLGQNSKGEDTVWLNIRPHKTTYGRRLHVLRTDGFFNADKIYELMNKHMDNGMVWPNIAQVYEYMQTIDKNGDPPGGATHDLRKYCARGLYRQERLAGKSKKDASEVVRKQLGHIDKDFTIGKTKGNGGYIGKVWVEDKGGKYQDSKIDWKTP